jgi:ABC-2 type transport system permease protein
VSGPVTTRLTPPPLREQLRVMPHVIAYEWRKASAFRGALVFRELLRGLGRPVVMVLVYLAMFESANVEQVRGYTFKDLVGYLVWTTVIFKCLTDERTFDVAEQIFDGYITKYLVMPVSFFALALGKVACFTGLQVISAIAFWSAGALLLPDYWPHPASGLAFLQACVLLALGAYCYALSNLILNYLAFWLDVVWSLLAMFRFISMFIGGMMVPITLMPPIAATVFGWTFPYWTVFGPSELLLGRMGSADFARGGLVLLGWAVFLHVLAGVVWRRGTARYAGAGA